MRRLAEVVGLPYTEHTKMLKPSELSRLASSLGGIPILGSLAGSPADAAGIRYGDILLAVDGNPTTSWDEFLRVRSRCKERLVARVFRQGTEFEVSIPLRVSKLSPLEVLAELQARGLLVPAPAGEQTLEQ